MDEATQVILGAFGLMAIVVIAVSGYSTNTSCTATIEGLNISIPVWDSNHGKYFPETLARFDSATFTTGGETCGDVVKNIVKRLEETNRR